MSETDLFPATAGESQLTICPFLGLAQDLQASLFFPSASNFCHRTKPYGTPNLEFQRSFCFSENHSNCVVFIRSGRAPLPGSIRFHEDKPLVGKRIILFLLIGGVVLSLGILGGLRVIQDRHNHNGNLSGAAGVSSPSAIIAGLATDTAPFTETPVPATIETATPQPLLITPSPTLTASPTPQITLATEPFTPTQPKPIHFPSSATPTRTFTFPVSTPVTPTDTAIPASNTPVIPSNTPVTPSNTPVPPSSTPITPTITTVAPSAVPTG